MATIKNIEAMTQRQISKAYNDALQAAIRKNREFLKRARDVDSGKIKPPAAYTTEKQIEAWKRGYMRRAAEKANVVQNIADEMHLAGVNVRKRIQSSMVTVYETSRRNVEKLLDKTIKANLPEMSRKQIEVLLYGQGNQSAFTKIAFNRLESDTVLRKRLRQQFAQSIQRGETQEQLLARIRNVTGREQGDAMRILRTESTHIESMAQQQTAIEHWRKTGVKPMKRWVCMFHNSRDSHIAMHGQTVGVDEYFTLPSGQPIKYPGDSSAGAAEVCNCQCRMEIVPGDAR